MSVLPPVDWSRFSHTAAAALPQGIIPRVHLAQLAAAIANPANSASGVIPVITVCGDSTGTQNANNAIAPSENLFGLLQGHVAIANPSASISWNDRSIGGSTWNDLKGIPNFAGGITAPSWYSATTQPWLTTYVKANAGIGNKAPDAIIIPMGTNDNLGIATANIKSVLDIIGNPTHFPIQPDLILVTPHGHTPNNSAETQNGYQQAAGLIRTIAQAGAGSTGNTTYTKRIGLIDIGRMDAMCRLGFDPVTQYLSEQQQLAGTIVNASGFPYLLPSCDGDFDLQLSFAAQGSSLFSGGNSIRIYAASAINGGTEENRALFAQSGSNFVGQWLGSTTINMTSGVQVGTGNVTMKITCKCGYVTIQFNGVTVFSQLVSRAGGKFQPRITMSAPPSGVAMTIIRYSAGVAIETPITISEAGMWGTLNGSAGGNGINHESSFGMQTVTRLAVALSRFGVDDN